MNPRKKSPFLAMLSVVLLMGVSACHGKPKPSRSNPGLSHPERSGRSCRCKQRAGQRHERPPTIMVRRRMQRNRRPHRTSPTRRSPPNRNSTVRMSRLRHRRRIRLATISRDTTRQVATPRAITTTPRISRKSMLPSRRLQCRNTSSPIARATTISGRRDIGIWSPAGYYWVPGAWVLAPYVGALWTPGYWGSAGGRYGWHYGYWGPYIGFYGGINYGYGYFGNGYQGGYWNRGAFYYNRSITRVNNNVRYVYTRNVSYNNRTRVSYNGGHGGLNARPNQSQLNAAKARRFGAIPAQRQLVRQAQGNRSQFAKTNNGRPSQVAYTRPVNGGRKTPAARPQDFRPAAGARPANNARPANGTHPANEKPANNTRPTNGGKPANGARPVNETRPAPSTGHPSNGKPSPARPATHPTQPRPETRPAQPRPEARPEQPKPASRPAQPRPETRPAPRAAT